MARTALLFAAGIAFAAPVSHAMAAQWGGSVKLASNHLLRGVSRSSNDPSLSAAVHVQGQHGWFAGAWVASSRVRPADDTSADVAATLGLGSEPVAGWSWRGSVSHYESPWQRQSGWYRYDELTLDLQLRDVLLLSASWSPNSTAYSPYYGPSSAGHAFAWEISLQQSLAGGWLGHAGAGYHDLSDFFGEGYWYGSIGLSWVKSRWQAGLSYIHPGAAARRLSWPGTARRRVLAELRYAF
jgi:uncharacterized protein (TIGR02001 family)